jgi:putative transposase
MATIRQKLESYAITILTHQRRSLFQRTENAELMIHTLFRYRDADRFALHAFAIMPDHLHVLITPAIDQSTSRCVQLMKGGFSFAVREQFKGEVWHSGYHEHRIRDAHDFEAQKVYIAKNPSRKNFVDYSFVHTRHEARIDPMPSHLLTVARINESIPQGLKPASSQP